MTIIGSLQLSEDIKSCGVYYGSGCDTQKPMKRAEFRKFLKFNARFFVKNESFEALEVGIGKLEMAIQTVANETSNNRGEYDAAASRAIKTNLPAKVKLSHQIYEGFEPQTYEAEVCFDIEDRLPVFWLESAELGAIIEDFGKEVIGKIAGRMGDLVKIVR